jgi:hypothetical protein
MLAMTPGKGDELVEELGCVRLSGLLVALAQGFEELGLGLRADRSVQGEPAEVGNTPVRQP